MKKALSGLGAASAIGISMTFSAATTAAAGEAGAAAAAPASLASNSEGVTTAAEIVVTANKREEAINKVGLTINAYSARTLQQQGVTSLQDLAVAVPGLSFTQTEHATPVYTLRGVGFYDTSLASYPTVSVYLDQAPLPFPVMTALTLFDLQRIEVLKGPQGILFGNNATGGAINYIAAKPTKDFSTGGSLSYGRFDTVQADGYVSGPLASNLLARAAFSVTNGDGWQISTSRPHDRNGAPDTQAGRLLFDWTPIDRLRFELNLNAWRDRTQPEQGQFVDFRPFGPGVPVGGPYTINATNNDQVADWSPATPPRADNSFDQITLRADYDITDAIVLTSLTSNANYAHDEVPDGDGVATHRQDVTIDEGYIRSFSEELRIANNNSRVFRWLVGGNVSLDRVYENAVVDFRDSTVPNLLPDWRNTSFRDHQRMENYAAFANGEYSVGRLTFKAGGRFTQANRTLLDACNYTSEDPASFPEGFDPQAAFYTNLSNLLTGLHQPVPGKGGCFSLNSDNTQRPFSAKLKEENFSWRLGADWQVSSDVLAYFNVAKGYKAGSFPTLSAGGAQSYDPVKQESVLSYEGGIKAQLFDHRLSVDLAGFYYDYNDKQLKSKRLDLIFGPVDALVNIPKSSIKGAEIEIQARPLTGLTVGLAATYLDATIDKFVGLAISGQLNNYAGSRIPYTPRLQVGGNANYEFPINETTQGFVGGQVTYRSDTNASVGSPKLFDLPAYTLLDLQAGVDFKNGRYRVMVWGKNVTNQFYVTNVISPIVDGNSRFTGRPTSYGVTVSFHY